MYSIEETSPHLLLLGQNQYDQIALIRKKERQTDRQTDSRGNKQPVVERGREGYG